MHETGISAATEGTFAKGVTVGGMMSLSLWVLIVGFALQVI